MQEIELFFNAGDYGRQGNWLIYPKSLDGSSMGEVSSIVFDDVEKSSDELAKIFWTVEEQLKRENLYPDPTKVKSETAWRFHQIENGAIMFRHSIDGRRESGTKRMNTAIEGIFLKGINLEKSVKKYDKIGIDIVDEIGRQFPSDIEKLLIGANFDLFRDMFVDYSNNRKLQDLFNHFYVACCGREIRDTRSIEVHQLQKSGPLDKYFK